MQAIKTGDLVTIEYEGRLKNGDTFENTADTGPLELEIGRDAVLPAFEQALLGMKIGETKIIEIPAENAYGSRHPSLVQSFDRQTFSAGLNLQPGMVMGVTVERDGSRQQIPGLVAEVNEQQVTIDFNHPLAGQALVYRITVKAIGGETGLPASGLPLAANSCRPSGCGGCH